MVEGEACFCNVYNAYVLDGDAEVAVRNDVDGGSAAYGEPNHRQMGPIPNRQDLPRSMSHLYNGCEHCDLKQRNKLHEDRIQGRIRILLVLAELLCCHQL